MKRLVTLLSMAAMLLTAYPVFAAVDATPHDYLGASGRGRCEVCHVPHAASSAVGKRLWRADISGWNIASEATGTWSQSIVGQLCGFCHGTNTQAPTITTLNRYNAQPHNVGATVYASTPGTMASHGRVMSTLTNTVASGGVGDTAANAAGRPYMNKARMECTSCHNPHDARVRPFLRIDANAVPTQNTISKVCGDCHNRYNTVVQDNAAPVTQNNAVTAAGSRSMHPIDVTYSDIAANNTNASGATQLHDPNAAMKTVVAALNSTSPWALGGKFQATATHAPGATAPAGADAAFEIGCQTCHAIHNPAQDAAGTSDDLYLLAVVNAPASSGTGNALCEGCHGGGANGVTVDMYVGAQRSTTTLDDHPIDVMVDGTPALPNWPLTARYERTPSDSPNSNWPYSAGGTYSVGGITIGRIVCTSCHSAHNGVTNTSINRGGGQASWCFSCHPNTTMVPGNHHSTVYDLTAASGSRGGNWDSSQIQCSGCHGGVTNPSAHMGFFNLVVADNSDSQLCNSCHGGGGATDPTAVDYNPGVSILSTAPNAHLNDPGASTHRATHYLGVFDDTLAGIAVKQGWWKNPVMSGGGRTGSFSKYGNGASTADTRGASAPTVTASSEMICESCHSILYNCGNGSLTGGWAVNLLLQNYEDNAQAATDGSIIGTHVDDGAPGSSANVGSGLCVACHNQDVNANGMGTANGFVSHSVVKTAASVPPNMHPMTAWEITRAQDAGIASPASQLDTTGRYSLTPPNGLAAVPGAGSYDAAGTGGTGAMSCDGCHRPHLAATQGTWDPAGARPAGTSVILESAGPNAGEYGNLCQECHGM